MLSRHTAKAPHHVTPLSEQVVPPPQRLFYSMFDQAISGAVASEHAASRGKKRQRGGGGGGRGGSGARSQLPRTVGGRDGGGRMPPVPSPSGRSALKTSAAGASSPHGVSFSLTLAASPSASPSAKAPAPTSTPTASATASASTSTSASASTSVSASVSFADAPPHPSSTGDTLPDLTLSSSLIVSAPNAAAVPQNRGTHTLFLHSSLSGVQMPPSFQQMGSADPASLVQRPPPRRRGQLSTKSIYATDLKALDADAMKEAASMLNVDTRAAMSSHRIMVRNAKALVCSAACCGKHEVAATRKCFSCVQLDNTSDGLHCDRCYVQRHPWYRVEHKWLPVEHAPDVQETWLDDLGRIGLNREYVDLKRLIVQAGVDTRRLQQLGKDTSACIATVHEARAEFNKVEGYMKKLSKTVTHVMTREEAATKLQGIWRVRAARGGMVAEFLKTFKRFYDVESDAFYYKNVKTGEMTWDCPTMLKGKQMRTAGRAKRQHCRFKAGDLTMDQAARHVQAVWQCKQARKGLRRYARTCYQKIQDKASGRYFYLNMVTNEKHWNKPLILGSTDVDIKTPRFHARDLTDDQAASHLQGMWRKRQARRRMQKMLASVYEKVYDEKRGKFYYYNRVTGASRWDKPKGLGSVDLDLTPRSKAVAPHKPPRFLAADLTDEQAASHLQGMWRSRQARRRMQKMLASVYEKVFDEKRGCAYYYNRITGEARWDKPKGLGLVDLELTPRSKAKAPHQPPRFHAADLTDEQAASHLQGMWRARIARRRFREMLASVYEKAWDEKLGKVYYYNRVTGQSHWTKPKGLGAVELDLTPRSRGKAPHGPPKFVAADLTEDEAASHLQGMWRSRMARRRMRKMLASVYEKVLDEASGRAYYYNRVTGEARWDKPKGLGSVELALTPRSRAKADASYYKPPRFHAADLSEVQAATYVQGMWRARRARERMRGMVASVFEKAWDEKAGRVYYFNKVTGESQWTKPRCLGQVELELTPRSRAKAPPAPARYHAADLTEEQAAVILQSTARMYQARMRAIHMVRERCEKVYDDVFGSTYYYDRVAMTSMWTKPKLLRSSDIEFSPRTHAHKKEDHALVAELVVGSRGGDGADGDDAAKGGPRVCAADMTPEEAAVHIQSYYRMYASRQRVVGIIRARFNKTYDTRTGECFYFDLHTELSSWTKPSLLRRRDLRLTPRSRALMEEDAAAGRRPLITAEELEPAQAAAMIQCLVRRTQARRKCRSLTLDMYTKGYDPGSGYYFYYNSRTGESVWEPPRLTDEEDFQLTPRSTITLLKEKRARGEDLDEDETEQMRAAREVHPSPRWHAAQLPKVAGAVIIQCMYRVYRACQTVRAIVFARYSKGYDPSSGTFYFYDNRTGLSSWRVPGLLGASELELTPRSTISMMKDKVGSGVPLSGEESEQYEAARAIHPSPRWHAADLSDDAAATVLQCMYRRWSARSNLRAAVRETYSKGYDPGSGSFYFYDARTGESMWEPPPVLGVEELELTPRSTIAMMSHKTQSGWTLDVDDWDELRAAKKAANNGLTPETAAIRIQSACRLFLSRNDIEPRIDEMYEKRYDGETEATWYKNSMLQTAWWSAPPLVFRGYDIDYTPRSQARTASVSLWGF